jgi:hypothetical protein
MAGKLEVLPEAVRRHAITHAKRVPERCKACQWAPCAQLPGVCPTRRP